MPLHGSALHGSAWHGALQDSTVQPSTARRGTAWLTGTTTPSPQGCAQPAPCQFPLQHPVPSHTTDQARAEAGAQPLWPHACPPGPPASTHRASLAPMPRASPPHPAPVPPAQRALHRRIFLVAHTRRGFPGLLAVPGAGHASSALLALGAAGPRASSGSSTGTGQVCWSTQGRAPTPSSGAGCAQCPGTAAIPSSCRGVPGAAGSAGQSPPGSRAPAVPVDVLHLFPCQHCSSTAAAPPAPARSSRPQGHSQCSPARPAPHTRPPQVMLPWLSRAPGTRMAGIRDRQLGPAMSQPRISPFSCQELFQKGFATF